MLLPHIPQKPLERRYSKPFHRENQLWLVSWILAGNTKRSLHWWTHWFLLSSRNGQPGNWSIKQPLTRITLLQVIFYSSSRKLHLNHLITCMQLKRHQLVSCCDGCGSHSSLYFKIYPYLFPLPVAPASWIIPYLYITFKKQDRKLLFFSLYIIK